MGQTARVWSVRYGLGLDQEEPTVAVKVLAGHAVAVCEKRWSHISFPARGMPNLNLNLGCVPDLCSQMARQRRRQPRQHRDELDAPEPEQLHLDLSPARLQALADCLRLWAPRVHQLTDAERQAFQQHVSFLDGILSA